VLFRSLIWKVEEKDSKGEIKLHYDFFSKTVHEKSKLLKAVRGFTGTNPVKPFRLRNLLGRQAELQIVHNEKNGVTYANVVAYLKPQPPTPSEKRSQPRTTKSAGSTKKEAPPQNEVDPVLAGAEITDEDVVNVN